MADRPTGIPAWIKDLTEPILQEVIEAAFPLGYGMTWVEADRDDGPATWWQLDIWPAGGVKDGEAYYEDPIIVQIGVFLDMLLQLDDSLLGKASITSSGVVTIVEMPETSERVGFVLAVHYTPPINIEPVYEVLDEEEGVYRASDGTIHGDGDPRPDKYSYERKDRDSDPSLN
jgi:hypothetical protein